MNHLCILLLCPYFSIKLSKYYSQFHVHFLSHYPDFFITSCSQCMVYNWMGDVQSIVLYGPRDNLKTAVKRCQLLNIPFSVVLNCHFLLQLQFVLCVVESGGASGDVLIFSVCAGLWPNYTYWDLEFQMLVALRVITTSEWSRNELV